MSDDPTTRPTPDPYEHEEIPMDEHDLREEPLGGRHPLNLTHLVMGIAFLGLVAVWGLVTADLVRASDVRWLLPVPWVLAGVAGLLALAAGRGRD